MDPFTGRVGVNLGDPLLTRNMNRNGANFYRVICMSHGISEWGTALESRKAELEAIAVILTCEVVKVLK